MSRTTNMTQKLMKAEHGPMNHNCPDVCAEKSSIFSFQLVPSMLVGLGSVEAPLFRSAITQDFPKNAVVGNHTSG